ncbi:hypothetical protein I350_07135 [Cryptococcus amylolentus CBS 6273]|uniref:RING-type domain-containing protein n=1 Tax=Cryptococcus amylolentus CBS 6273 TaxID=1296118 RepID=A0A1E3JDR1_9TREE|nr:hypothetical protein I350_07135 [Cryptococcus amylolentus CBS 6273]
MKYGKEFQQLLNESDFPEEWKSSAIEYRQLKKVIKDVVAELTSMGLSPDVLHKLLITEDTDGKSLLALHTPVVSDGGGDGGLTGEEGRAGEEDVIEFEFESEEGSPVVLRSGSVDLPPPPHHQPVEVIVHPVTEQQNLDDDEQSVESLHPHHHRRFRLRLLSETSQTPKEDGTSVRPLSVTDIISAQEHTSNLSLEDVHHRGRGSELSARVHGKRKVVKKAVSDGHGGVKAEYVLIGDPQHPIPQLRLHLDTSISPSRSHSHSPSPAPSSFESETEPETETETETEDENGGEEAFDLAMKTPRAFNKVRNPSLPSSPHLSRIKGAQSPIWAIASTGVSEGMSDFSIGEAAVAEIPSPLPDPPSPDLSAMFEPASALTTEREFIIPLASDLAFFSLLTTALTSLSLFHARQQTLFQQSVERLCAMISKSISPQGSSLEVLPTPLTPSGSDMSDTVPRLHASTSAKASKKDLYAWREIFSLWIESQIFESTAERDRGERTIEQAESRLQKFAAEVVKRRLGDRRTMKGKKVREAWEEFLRLNMLLLDLKRFQTANIKAAQKILKKHDKRTALTASTGFQSFVRSTLTAHSQIDKDGHISTWTFYNTSLPHVLLSSLTSTLLPILPSLDDYACLICTSIAFKPIRLECGHLFCVRCLVKMQKAGKGECPLCRKDVVLLADKSSLDLTIMHFMKQWFPKEVKEKQKENDAEVVNERALETGLDTRCAIM